MLIKQTRKDRIFTAVIYTLLIFCTLICLYPLWLVVINSFSNPTAVASGKVFLLPKGFSFEAYKIALQNKEILRGYANSLFYTVFGVAINMLLTIPCAYALSKKELIGGKPIMMIILFTMYFSGGIVPEFLLMKKLHLLNTWWAIPLIGGVYTTNLIVARSFFFYGVPHELEESAELDGCNALQTFVKIVLPISKAMLGVILLYYAVGRWNSYISALYYLPMAPEKYPLQMVLRQMMMRMQNAAKIESPNMQLYSQLLHQIKYSVIVLASVPLLAVYPFIQKFFEKGIMLGSVKG